MLTVPSPLDISRAESARDRARYQMVLLWWTRSRTCIDGYVLRMTIPDSLSLTGKLIGLIALTHIHKETPGLRLRKRYRIALRFSVAIILVCLPLVESLHSMQLVGITTSLIVFVLGTELWCASCCHDSLWDKSKCQSYVGVCDKKNLAAMARKIEGDSDADTLVDETGNAGATIAH